jgi:hypothetical protein
VWPGSKRAALILPDKSIRLAENFTERKGGKITGADGQARMANVWGKRSDWVDYSAEADGEQLGVVAKTRSIRGWRSAA